MKMHDLFDMGLYANMVHEGYIRLNRHPDLPLYILNYTEHAQFDRMWNEVTLQCRGLIVDQNNDVIARPFDKFFNYGEPFSPNLDLDTAVRVTDKMDGSLGILWNYKGQQGIATRGSFVSDQAIHATKIWKEKYNFPVSDCWTYLFEIIYPENRIVLNYGDLDDLVLLGVRDNVDGSVVPAEQVYTWRGPRTTTFQFSSLSEALAAPSRGNAEGFVIETMDGKRVKIKQEDYVALHKIVTGLTKRRVWENMKEGKTLDDLCEIVPDEWHDWLRETYWDIDTEIRGVLRQLDDYFPTLAKASNMIYDQGLEWNVRLHRKNFAELVKDHPYKSLMFLLLSNDQKKLRNAYFDLVKPAAE